MRYLKINLKNIASEQINFIVDYLKRGKVVAYPTDTIYGLGCVATNKDAINKIYKIKKRNKKNPLLVLVKSYRMLRKYCYVSKKQNEYLKKIWNKKDGGAVSVVLKHRKNLPKELFGELDSAAVRIPSKQNLPKNDFLIKMIKGVNLPIVSTSLNISGKENLKDVGSLKKYYKKDKPDLIIDVGKIKKLKVSKLIDLRDVNNIKILRK